MSRVLKTLVVLLPAAACLSGPKQDLSALSRRSALSLAPSIGAAALVGSGATGGQLLRVPSAGAAVAPPADLIPNLGIGAWAWGDTLFWGYDDKKDGELQELFDYCVDKGFKFFDTAEVYGLGRSETLLGKFCRANSNAADVKIATKFAALPWRTKASDVVDAAQRSTERLGRPIDLYQIHFPNAWSNEAYWDGLGECVDRGLVRAVGVSNYGAEALRACHAKLQEKGVPLVSNQIQVSLLYPYALNNGLIDTCKELNVKPVSEHHLLNHAEPLMYIYDPQMKSVGEGYGGASPAQIAIAWCIAKGTCPIPGARTLTQAKSNLAAASIKLTAQQVAVLDSAAAAVTLVLKPDSSPFAKKDVFTKMTMFDS
ncbi:NADP-dependent oxidoreductase domain-containing protein [Pavlovales sp. CCMP2436]|nr:NADP-dependent oxidoreductase domain-containing protein [Pavlovales sp. CCMP2436]